MPRYRFGEFEFDPDDGALTRLGDGTSSRLAPQPAKLLGLLLQRAGDVVSKEEIDHYVWGYDVVDIEPRIHACVSQVRAALRDSAANPAYIETVHRRGYMLLPPVAQVEAHAPANKTERTVVSSSPFAIGTAATAGIVTIGAVIILGLAFVFAGSDDADPAPTRVAVTSFSPGHGVSIAASGVAEQLVHQLMNQRTLPVEIVGPTTTRAYEVQSDGLRRLSDEYDIEYIINGRFPANDSTAAPLAEVIRTADGAHVWTWYVEASASDSLAAATIIEGFVGAITSR